MHILFGLLWLGLAFFAFYAGLRDFGKATAAADEGNIAGLLWHGGWTAAMIWVSLWSAFPNAVEQFSK